MAQQINFSGINRAVSDYSNTGACEELINLRPTPTGLVPVKPFSKKMEGVTFNKLYEHNVGGQVNYIAITFANDGSSLSVDRVSEEGEVISNLVSITTPPLFSSDSLHVATTGRILTISISDKASGTYENYCFRWRNNSYETLEANIPPITPTFTIDTPTKITQTTGSIFDTGWTLDSNKAADLISTAFSAIQTKNPAYCFGPVIVAIALKTIDGDTFWTGQWYTVNPVPKINNTLSGTSDKYHFTSNASFPNTLAVNGSAYLACKNTSVTSQTTHQLAGAPIAVTIPALQNGAWNKETSILKSIEIYVSRPSIYSDYSFSKCDPEAALYDGDYWLALPELMPKDMNLGGQILYLQKSISLEELASAQQEFDLRFGGNIQITDKTLEVDPGMIVRTGNMLAYNARYHFYNANKRVFLGKPYFAADSSVTKANSHVFLTYESENIKKMVYVGTMDVPASNSTGSMPFSWTWCVVTVPGLNITKVTVLKQSSTVASVYLIGECSLSPSTAYNYSIDDSGAYTRDSSITATSEECVGLLALIAAGPVDHIDETETDAINVSEQYNPFVFRVNHSYLAPATVLDLQPQLMAVADISIGSAPLDVFTTQGVYALLQGDGEVLYSAFHALSNLISERNSASTDAGTFFIASGNLWRIAGLHSELVSDALSLGPHKEIRSCSSYQSLSNNSTNTYDISPYESDPIFEDYSKGASLVYNRFRDELIVSNPSYDYSYVLSLKYRQWFKIPHAYRQEVVGSDLVNLGVDTKVLEGTFAKVMIQRWYASEGATIDFDIWVNDRTYIEFQTHTATAAEEADDDTNGAPLLLVQHLVSEWNTLIAAAELPLVATADTSYTGSVGRFINIAFAERVDDVKSVDSHLSAISGDSTQTADQYPIFKTPHDIYDFSDEAEYEEGTRTIPAGSSAEVKINASPLMQDDTIDISFSFNGSTVTLEHTVTGQEANTPVTAVLIPNLISEIGASAAIQALGMGLTVTRGADAVNEYIDLVFTTSSVLDDNAGGGIVISITTPDWAMSDSDTISSTPGPRVPVALTAHLQSRPISFGYAYTHIHRVVDMVRSTLYTGYNLTVALYGSDDLHSWSLLSYANREGSAAGLSISQLRTPSTARAWRYYTITIGGIIPIDTDFGPVLLDEQPVVRRIG